MGIAHLDEAPAREYDLGHLRGRWTMVGNAAGCVNVGVRRIQLPAGGWSTPAHEHGRDEEIFYVLGGRGLSWQAGNASEVGAGDCIVYLPGRGAHTLHALDPLDVLAFGERNEDESVGFPRLGMSYAGNRLVGSMPGRIDGTSTQFVLESQLGPPPLPPDESAPRPSTIVNVEDVEAVTVERTRVVRTRRNVGRAAGSVTTGIQHVQVAPGKESAPAQCHSLDCDCERQHDQQRHHEGEPERRPVLKDRHERQGCEQHHGTLREVEHAGRLVNQDETERDQRVHQPGE